MAQLVVAQSNDGLLSLSSSSSSIPPPQMISGTTPTSQPNTNGNPAINVVSLSFYLNKEEEKMTLAQLLSCFPEVPSNIPIQLNPNQHKLRRDTVVSPPVITSKASSLVDAPKQTNIPLSLSITNLHALNSSSSNLLAYYNKDSKDSNNNNSNIITSSTEELPLAPPSQNLLQQQQSSSRSPTPICIPDNISESSSCSISSSNSIQNNIQPPSKITATTTYNSNNSINLSKSQSLDNISSGVNEITISSNNPIPLPPQQQQSSTPPPTRRDQTPPTSPTSSSDGDIFMSPQSTSSITTPPTSPNVISSSTSSSSLSTPPSTPPPLSTTTPTTTATATAATSTTSIKLPPSSPNISRKTQAPTSSINNNSLSSPSNNNVVNNKNLNINQQPSQSSSFSPTKRLTIAFGSLTRGSSQATVETSVVPQRWEINLNQNKIVLNSNNNNTHNNNDNQLFEQYYKLVKGDYQQNTSIYNKTFNQLLEIDMNTSLSTLDKCYESMLKNNGGSLLSSSKDQFLTKDKERVKSLFTAMKNVVTEDIANVKPSKTMLYFGCFGKTIPINQEVVDECILNNFSSKKVKFKVIMGPPSKSHTITVSEKEGFINKKSSITLNFSLILKSSIKLRRVVIIEIEGGIRYHILGQVESNKTAFGQPIEDSELVEDNTSFGPMLVPRALVVLKQAFFSCNAHTTESIFRLPPSNDTEYNICKDRINREAIGTIDPHCIATLLKVFFRELPNLLLNEIDPQIFLNFKPTAQSADTASSAGTATTSSTNNNRNTTNSNSNSSASTNSGNGSYDHDSNGMDSVFIVNLIEEKKRSTFLWLIDLLAEISKFENVNKMNSKSLAIIFSPNLYFAPSICSAEDSFAISGKVVSFLLDLLSFHESVSAK